MFYRSLEILLLILICGHAPLLYGSGGAAHEVPFWKEQADLYKKIESDRAIVARVQSDDPGLHWVFSGAGHIQAPFEKSWVIVRQYERLALLQWFFKKVEFQRETQRLWLTVSFLGLSRQLRLKVEEVRHSRGGTIFFQVEEGYFQGFKGQFDLSGFRSATTEVALSAKYVGKVPLFRWLFISATEVAMRYIARELREVVEGS